MPKFQVSRIEILEKNDRAKGGSSSSFEQRSSQVFFTSLLTRLKIVEIILGLTSLNSLPLRQKYEQLKFLVRTDK